MPSRATWSMTRNPFTRASEWTLSVTGQTGACPTLGANRRIYASARYPEYVFELIGGRDLPNGCKGQLNRMFARNDMEFLLSLLLTTASLDEPSIPNEAARLRRIQGETRFDAAFEAMKKRRAA